MFASVQFSGQSADLVRVYSVRLIPRRFIERRAALIHDPIARLRYLQRSVIGASTGRTRSARRPAIWIIAAIGMFCLLVPAYEHSLVKASLPPKPLVHALASTRADVMPNAWPTVWLVDQSNDLETYSNGLRIDDRYVTPNQKRVFYPVYQRGSIDAGQPEWRSQPAGIVYHTTESDQARFSADENARLKWIAKAVIGVVQQKRSYHFFIDRFGQVFRIVPESDIANHAGYSVWADGNSIFVNLNSSFLGIAFETQTQLGDQPSANPAQVHAARVLTEMLRAKYHIPQSNCVTHAQVSVNPDNMLIGYHTDWAGNFPFRDVGLADNYATPPASIYAFGFEYDPAFVHATGTRLWQGLTLADDQVRMQAAAHGMSVPAYRSMLQKQYKEILAALKALATAGDNRHDI